MVKGAEFPRVARGSPSTDPVASGGRGGDWAPDRAGVRSVRESNVDSPSCRAIRKCRAICKYKRRGVVEQRIPGARGLGHVVLGLLPCGKTLHVSWDPDRLKLRLSPEGIDARNMAESDCIEDRRSRGSDEATLEAASGVLERAVW